MSGFAFSFLSLYVSLAHDKTHLSRAGSGFWYSHKVTGHLLFNRQGRISTRFSLKTPSNARLFAWLQLRLEEGQRGHQPVQQLQSSGGEGWVPPHQPDLVG